MGFFDEIFLNQPLIASLIAFLIAQFLKIAAKIAKGYKFDFKWLISTGGFPSAHSAAVSALAVSLGINFGFDSGLFALSTVFAGIVIFDARVIRKASGSQAEILNKIVEDLYKKRGLKGERLKELLGHTSLEIFFGIVLGILTAILLCC